MKSSIFNIIVLILFQGLIANASDLRLDDTLPVDPKVIVGKLENGLTYYIRENHKPEHRAEIRLAVNAGSVLEDEYQQGFAHLGEHMAFNGTEHFHKQKLINYLESIGMKFGPEINAYTSFDEVVYMLQLPTDSLDQFKTGFQILEDWAHLVSYEDEEITKERGVVIEEWRLGQGAMARMRDKYFPILFQNSQYAKRLPIGKIDILQNDDNDAVRQFYKDWYRPDLLAVVAVGDFDAALVEALIKKHFSQIPLPENPRKRIYFDVPDHRETLYAIVTDPEAPRTSVAVYFKHRAKDLVTLDDYRHSLVERLYNRMFNNRLDELRQQTDPPFIYASSANGRIVRTKEVYYLGAGVREDGVVRGLDALFTEAMRVKKYGFVESELERAKTSLLRMYERAYNERDKTESTRYASEYVNNYLEHETIPGIENEYAYAQTFFPEISLEDVNRLIDDFITDSNRVVIVQMPEKESVTPPTEAELAAVMQKAEQKELVKYVDKTSDAPLVAQPPAPGKIVAENTIPELGVTRWTLSNGMQVLLKPTDFKNDEIRFAAYSWGGSSLGSTDDWVSIRSAAAVVNQSGWGEFNAIELSKKLSGKIVNMSTGISETMETVSGSASPQDMESAFQLLYLAFTAPREDQQAFDSYKARVKGYLENQGAMPEAVFADTISAVMSNYHPRRMPFVIDDLPKMDLHKMVQFYKQRFADAGEFTFFFVGNFEPETLKPLVQTYLAALPNKEGSETWRDVGVRPPKGKVQRIVHRGREPKARVRLIFTGEHTFDRQNNYMLYSLRDVAKIKLREVIREDKSGTYGVSVSASVQKIPEPSYRLSISFGCDPARVNELKKTVFAVIDSMKSVGPAQKYINKVKETDLRTYETDLQKNSFWLSRLQQYHRFGWEPTNIIKFPELVNGLSAEAIRQAAKKYFGENVATFILLPENQ